MEPTSTSDQSPDSLNATGIAYARNKQFNLAIAAFDRAIALDKNHFDAHNNLGAVLFETRQFDPAIEVLKRATTILPNSPEAHYNLAQSYKATGRYDAAIASYQRAIAIKPDYFQAHSNLGALFYALRQLDLAIASLRRAIAIHPNSVEALNNLGAALKESAQIDAAQATLQRAVQIDPRSAAAHNNLGNVLRDQGQHDQALNEFRAAIQIEPAHKDAWDSLLMSLHYHPAFSANAVLSEHHRWESLCAKPCYAEIKPHANDRSPDRTLRIGYSSPELILHPVGRFLDALFDHHDHKRFEIIVYSDVIRPDAMTQSLRKRATQWHNTAALSDAELADKIRADKIDVLVDLTLHASRNRMLTFARKPAPVQITYLAYNSTSGLSTMDYRLTDNHFDPPDRPAFGIETSLRLPSYWCYRPPTNCPELVPEPPVNKAGYITFACFNNYNKVTTPALQAWARILAAVPNARLVLYCPSQSQQDRLRALFSEHNVSPDRLEFPRAVPLLEYLAAYNRIDIALDPFPYNGGTTTCDALWMGVPVVTLAGEFGVARAGVSLLSTIGLTELIAPSIDQYVSLAAALAHDAPRLREIRSTLRDRMKRSSLMDEPLFARSIESLYRQGWQAWCNG